MKRKTVIPDEGRQPTERDSETYSPWRLGIAISRTLGRVRQHNMIKLFRAGSVSTSTRFSSLSAGRYKQAHDESASRAGIEFFLS